MIASLLVFDIQHSLFHICQELEIYVFLKFTLGRRFMQKEMEGQVCVEGMVEIFRIISNYYLPPQHRVSDTVQVHRAFIG